jgi:hypothetical protein
MVLNSTYDIKDTVRIAAIGMVGVVLGIEWNVNGIQYEVAYWNDGQRYIAWMYEWEITKEVQ